LRVDHAIGTDDVVPEQVTSGITEKLVITGSFPAAGLVVGDAVTVTVAGAADVGAVPLGVGAQPARTRAPATPSIAAADRTSPMAPLPDRAGDPGEMISQPAR